MQIKYNFSSGNLTISLKGELDEYTATKSREIIDNLIYSVKGLNAVIFKMSDLTFMDSTGIGMLIGRYKKINNLGAKVYIENPSNQIRKILEISGLLQIMKVI